MPISQSQPQEQADPANDMRPMNDIMSWPGVDGMAAGECFLIGGNSCDRHDFADASGCDLLGFPT